MVEVRPLSADEARALQREMALNIAEAISKTATRFLCVRRERIPERKHLVGLLTDLLCDGSTSRDVLGHFVGLSERTVEDCDYDDAQEEIEAFAEIDDG